MNWSQRQISYLRQKITRVTYCKYKAGFCFKHIRPIYVTRAKSHILTVAIIETTLTMA